MAKARTGAIQTRYTGSRSRNKGPLAELGCNQADSRLGQAWRHGLVGHRCYLMVSGACCPSGMKLLSLPSCDSWTLTSTMPPKASRTFT